VDRKQTTGLWDWNIDTGEVYYSPRFKQLPGLHRAGNGRRRGGIQFALAIRRTQAGSMRQAIDGHLQRGGPFDIEMRPARPRNGEYRWFPFPAGQALRTPAGRAMRMAGAMTDTTDRRLTAAELSTEKRARSSHPWLPSPTA